ncbi:Vesicle-associated membrane protein-associated protein A [Trachymyrmex cornetzi]|uniref:Vesicle-associated membrane protein-associated protein A n=1 Tax=Trachymyrmex cornetzi TaxID=471704 RepID=A0A151IRH8_9HYME|nr:Vesicle-associated membrane protein-associated protein A [Trachymyrmex cornetzi]
MSSRSDKPEQVLLIEPQNELRFRVLYVPSSPCSSSPTYKRERRERVQRNASLATFADVRDEKLGTSELRRQDDLARRLCRVVLYVADVARCTWCTEIVAVPRRAQIFRKYTILSKNVPNKSCPFTGGPVTSYIKLINPTNKKVYFKIKTTAPKRYCVRPNSGALKPKDVTEIAVCLQPYDFDPSEKNKHKFMVQTVVAPDDDDDEYPIDVWKDINPDQLMDSKLKCVFENPVINTTSSTVKMTATSTTTKADSNATNGKNKTVGDSVKSSPKVLGEAEEKLIKAAQEVNQLREDLMKWRNAALGNDGNLAAARGLTSQSNSQLSPTSTSILIAFAMVIVGYLLGKLI